MKYKLLAHTDNHELSRVVNTYLNKGWQLYGLTLSSPIWDDGNANEEVEYAQALIKKDEGGT